MSEITQRLKTAIADRYRIERELGQGGMATVYLAHDVKHDRKVALKILRPELAAVIGAERFLQEIKVTANLQHSHILPLYDSGAAEGFLFYVMPYVEGETLRTKLQKEKQLGIEEAVELTRAIASALEHAHKQGVIHRDIKPENILLRDGDPLIADFGIALALSHAGGSRLTETGLSIGTPHYMSPEQAMGDREMDARSDIYSLGAVLYEMLAGDPPYTGSTAQAIVAKVITEKAPPVTTFRDTVPPHVAAAVQKALNKLPADRFPSAAGFAEALRTPGLVGTADVTAVTPSAPAAGRRAPRPVAVGSGWAAAALIGAVALWGWLRPGPPAVVSRYSVAFPPEQALANARGNRVALSPDGSRVVYIGIGEGGNQLWVRARDQLRATPLPGTTGAVHVFFGPDGSRVGFVTDDQHIKVVGLSGGPPVTVADSGVGLDGATWSGDGYIYFDGFTGGTTVGLQRVPVAGGPIEAVTTVDPAAGETDHVWPVALPESRGVLFTIVRAGDARSADIGEVGPDGGEHGVLVRGATGRYAASGHLLYVTADGTLMAAPFDVGRRAITGEAVSLAGGVGLRAFGAVDLAVANDGTLLYVAGARATDPSEIVSIGSGSDVRPIDPGWVGDFRTLALSPDGRRLAVSIAQESEQQIWVKELPDGPLTKLSFEGPLNYRPNWTPDGRAVTYVSQARGGPDLFVKRADGSGQAEVALDLEAPVQEGFRSRDGEWIVYRTTPRDIYAVSRAGDTVTVTATPYEERAPALSPDGRWIAYQSDESGRYEIYVRPFPDAPSAKWQVSTGGGRIPRWAPDGRSLYYASYRDEMIAVQVLPGPTFTIGERRALFPVSSLDLAEGSYDITPDGSRFIMIRLRGAGDDSELIVVENLFTELERMRP